jgi:Arc/MetJ family transcription regulator
MIAFYAHSMHPMRTNIVIDDQLMNEALKLTGVKTKKDAVELGLKMLIRLKKQEKSSVIELSSPGTMISMR